MPLLHRVRRLQQWAADFSQNEIFGWTLIETGDDAERVAELILAAPSYGRNRTSISGAIKKGVEVLEASPYDGFRRVIDISGDGPNNQGDRVVAARDERIAKSIAEQRAYLPVYTVRDELLSVVREHQVRVTSLFCLSSP